MKRTYRILLGILLIGFFLCMGKSQKVEAASSYTNAYEFYESTGNGDTSHSEVYSGHIYFATGARQATSSTALRYHTLGFDVTLSGNGTSVSFGVKRGASMTEIDSETHNGYEYLLYRIADKELYRLARMTNSEAADKVLSASIISVRIDAIMTTKQNEQLHGNVSEDGNGGLIESGTIYHLKDSQDWERMKSIFTGHTFVTYRDIRKRLDNYLLTVRYNVEGTPEANVGCSSTTVVGAGYRIQDGILHQGDKVVTTQSRLIQSITLLNPSNVGLSKTGYHLESGKEWIYGGRSLATNMAYMPQDVCPGVGLANKGITLYSNWKPNQYSIVYSANGGNGLVPTSTMTYDVSGKINANAFSKPGYHLVEGAEWNTKPDGTGTSYAAGQTVKNLVATNNGSITLYAAWEPDVFAIYTMKEGGTGGTDTFYEKYNTGWYLDAAAKQNKTTSIEIPVLTGYNFMGYYQSVQGLGEQIVGQDGTILAAPNFYLADSRVYAYFTPKEYTITFDKQGGTGGTDSVTAKYKAELPNADAPVRNGYAFKGYYTEPEGAGTLFYNEHMAPDTRYEITEDVTLYAYWVDETAPEVTLLADITIWTNRKVVLTAEAFDYGVGLKSLKIYRGDTLVKEASNLKGVKTKKITYSNAIEGAVTYRAVAEDMNGHTKEAFETVYYDATDPQGFIVRETFGSSTYSVTVQVTDQNVK